MPPVSRAASFAATGAFVANVLIWPLLTAQVVLLVLVCVPVAAVQTEALSVPAPLYALLAVLAHKYYAPDDPATRPPALASWEMWRPRPGSGRFLAPLLLNALALLILACRKRLFP